MRRRRLRIFSTALPTRCDILQELTPNFYTKFSSKGYTQWIILRADVGRYAGLIHMFEARIVADEVIEAYCNNLRAD